MAGIDRNDSTITITWNPPYRPRGKLDFYVVSIEKIFDRENKTSEYNVTSQFRFLNIGIDFNIKLFQNLYFIFNIVAMMGNIIIFLSESKLLIKFRTNYGLDHGVTQCKTGVEIRLII